ncbi:TniQ family protein [Streptomyces zagrosensis]|uniref:TniQ domain-containing protein n=1 Tax=Streptomyces zagrosensis TaxID=1042984 RepID=A0A7W9Q8S1_9ACTN|nr:TniQ family protein [Streptomyces zagrosensis]MBB5935710.1 hypothetical protein [Streptomyces zagrosensis]
MPPPLPRSLDPLPGEGLPGYLLRLAHRLDLSPADLARRTGLLPAGRDSLFHLRHHLLIDPPPDDLAAFADATRLTHEEADARTLRGLRDHYPPLARSLEQAPGTGRRRIDGWLFTGFSRFCPKCLAGDGSPIQQAHGGPWKKEWHLAVVFACPEHECFLQHQCPTCHRPDRRLADPLVIRPGARHLHPTQCRFPAPDSGRGMHGRPCGARIELAGNPIRPSPRLLDVQRDLLDELDPNLPQALTAESLTDLRLVTGFIAAAWPQSRHLLDSDLVDPVNAYFQANKENHPGKLRGHHVKSLDKAPRDAVVFGALIGIADELLFADNVQQRITGLFDAAFHTRESRTSWARFFAHHERTCSTRMRDIMRSLISAYPGIIGRRIAPFRGSGMGFAPHQIPAFLEQDWYERFIRPTRFPVDERRVRRTAAAHLVCRAAQCTLREATHILGIPEGSVRDDVNDDAFWTGAKDAPIDFRLAVVELGTHLHEIADQLPDYQRRRDILSDWVLPEETWRKLTSDLPEISGKRPVLDDRKRQVASIFIWTRVTAGEHLFAPRPLEQAQPEQIRQAWAARRPTTWHQLAGRHDPGPHYAALRQLLTEYAGKLAKEIDAGDPLANGAVT